MPAIAYSVDSARLSLISGHFANINRLFVSLCIRLLFYINKLRTIPWI